MQRIEIIECPRDAMQGIKQWIPTEQKIRYAQSLLKVGFDVLDVGVLSHLKPFRKCRIQQLCLQA